MSTGKLPLTVDMELRKPFQDVNAILHAAPDTLATVDQSTQM